ncbi:MAG: low temperature requirement protein A [Gaiellaceae bacterium]
MSTGPDTTPTIRHPLRPLIARTDLEGHRQATWLELFFDLCFVVAIAALARAFHGDATWEGAAIFVGLFVPLWWTWIAFTWFGNTFDNDDVVYRVTVFGGMLAIVWLASSAEAAAEGRGFAFALAYIVLQLLVLALNVRARMHVPAHPDVGTHDLIAGWINRQMATVVIGLVPWVVSLFVDGTARYALWAAGLALHLMGPVLSLRVFEADQGWHVEEHHTDRAKAAYGVATSDEPLLPVTDIFHLDHIRERYGLFTIIVLGESVLAVSIGISEVGWNITAMLTASLAFLAAVSIWWTYFDRSGRDALTSGLGASFVWGYGHLAIFAGIAALGVGTELMIEAAAAGAAEHAADEEVVAAVHSGGLPGTAIFAGGAAAFWIGMTVINLANLGFRLTNVGRWFVPARLALAAVIIVLAFVDIDPLAFAAAAGGLMVALNAAETMAVYRFQKARATAKGAPA